MKKSLLKQPIMFIIVLSIILGFIMLIVNLSNLMIGDSSNVAFAADESVESPIVNVKAEFAYVRLNDTNCSVRIKNKKEATVAVIPSVAIIDGKKYTVTEVASNGFSYSSKLKRVTLSSNIIKIGSSAFSNCSELEKISLSNVQTIGNSAFSKCTKLSEIIIPETVSSIGAYAFKNNNTRVRIRANDIGEDWLANWNSDNANQDVEFNCVFEESIIFEPIYSTGSNTIRAYKVASGQPFIEPFYIGKDITVPSKYNSLSVESLDENCYTGVNCSKLIFEYSEQPINIPSKAFEDVVADEIIINRDITMNDETESDNDFKSTNLFANTTVSTIVLPDTIPFIAKEMFYGCESVKNIYFVSPSKEYKLENTENIVDLTHAKLITSIGESAFAYATSLKGIRIPHQVTSVGAIVFDAWTENQEIYIDYIYNTQVIAPTVNDNGWQKDWNSGCKAKIIYEGGYNINLDMQGGTGGANSALAKYNEAMPNSIAPKKTDYVFLGYFTKPNGEGTQYYDSDMNSTQNWDIIAPEGDSVTLYADWIRIIKVTSARSEINITDTKASIWFEKAFDSKCTVYVSSNTILLGMDGYGRIYNMNVVINSRSSALTIIAKNIGIYSHSDQPAINTKSSSDLYLYTLGIVNIFGTTKSDGNGSEAIVCGSLYICSTETGLLISGGDGADGISDTVGTNGGDGGVGIVIDRALYILCNNVLIYGGSPGDGGKGAVFGGYGGNGAYPVGGTSNDTTIIRLQGLENVHLYKSVDGADGGNMIGDKPVLDPDRFAPGILTKPDMGGITIPRPPISGGVIK